MLDIPYMLLSHWRHTAFSDGPINWKDNTFTLRSRQVSQLGSFRRGRKGLLAEERRCPEEYKSYDSSSYEPER